MGLMFDILFVNTIDSIRLLLSFNIHRMTTIVIDTEKTHFTHEYVTILKCFVP